MPQSFGRGDIVAYFDGTREDGLVTKVHDNGSLTVEWPNGNSYMYAPTQMVLRKKACYIFYTTFLPFKVGDKVAALDFVGDGIIVDVNPNLPGHPYNVYSHAHRDTRWLPESSLKLVAQATYKEIA